MAVHPGMMIKPELDERGISQKEFAKMIGTQPSHLSEVLSGKRALTTELAVKIENAIGLPAKILLSAQTQYELESTVEDSQHETVAVTIPVRDRSLLQELVRKFGWACVFLMLRGLFHTIHPNRSNDVVGMYLFYQMFPDEEEKK